MSLFGGDLTTPKRFGTWAANPPSLPSDLVSQLITSMSALIRGKLNRGHLYSRSVTDTFDGVGNYQLLLPAYPATAITKVQMGSTLVQASPLPDPTTGVIPAPNTGYGYRFIPWNGGLPGEPFMLELVNGAWWPGVQNIKVTYTAGYRVSNETWTVPATPFQITVLQPTGLWCRDNGVTYANGTALVAVTTITGAGQYIPPAEANPGLYTFGTADAGASVLISYSFIPADLEEACIQMVAERYSYRTRIGEEMKTLGGQESVRFNRGTPTRAYGNVSALPPEVLDLIWPYVSTIPPIIGAPL